MDLAHIIRITHHDTGRVVLFCGEERDQATDPPPGVPPCADCVLAALNAARHESRERVIRLAEAAVEDARRASRSALIRYDDVTLRLERVEKALAKIKRKKGKR